MFNESAYMNNRQYIYYVQRFTELAISMFEWKNLPPSVDARFLELTLYTDGQAVFFNDEVMGPLALQVLSNGPFNVYRVPIRRRAYAVNGYQRELDMSDSVIIYNNLLRTNTEPDMRLFARRLYDLDRTIDVNARSQKTPTAVKATEEQRLSMINYYKDYDGNLPYIFVDKSFDLSDMQAIDLHAPFVADKLYQLKTQLWNEALTYLGISNLTIQKKERVNTDEVSRSMGGTIASRYSRLEARRLAADEINNMFGLDIKVDFREGISEDLIGPVDPEKREEGGYE